MTTFVTDEFGNVLTDGSGRAVVYGPPTDQAVTRADVQGFDFSVDLLRALLWQYNEAANLQGLLERKSQWYGMNQTEFWNDWHTDVFNLATANDFGLNVWSVILGQSIYTNFNPSPSSKKSWGFGAAHVNFTRGNFNTQSGGTFQLPAEAARLLLQLRYFQLVSSGTVPETNRMLKYLFGTQGAAYLVDNHDMTQTYVFEFTPTSIQQYLFNNFDVLPRPAGVYSSISF